MLRYSYVHRSQFRVSVPQTTGVLQVAEWRNRFRFFVLPRLLVGPFPLNAKTFSWIHPRGRSHFSRLEEGDANIKGETPKFYCKCKGLVGCSYRYFTWSQKVPDLWCVFVHQQSCQPQYDASKTNVPTQSPRSVSHARCIAGPNRRRYLTGLWIHGIVPVGR